MLSPLRWSLLVRLWIQLPKRNACARARKRPACLKSRSIEKKGFACEESATGPGALPGAKKNERLRYSECVLTAEAEWPVKLQTRDRPAARSKEEREVALLRIRAYGRSRMASETADERQARLRNSWMERLAAESTDDRQAVLQRLRTCVRRLKRMVLPRARPTVTMLCIH